MSTGNPLRTTHVVTGFLFSEDQKEPRILIVKRSQRVGSYNGKWAGISGFVETDVSPDEQMYTEIHEETGLRRDQVRMLRRGSIVEHIDTELGRHFYIHPFLLEVFNPQLIKTNWEADDISWIDPAELGRHETVPKLQEAFNAAIRGEEVIPD
jgi:ADP-ribose pyrophosphatase YjhB (NUDIX family)